MHSIKYFCSESDTLCYSNPLVITPDPAGLHGSLSEADGNYT